MNTALNKFLLPLLAAPLFAPSSTHAQFGASKVATAFAAVRPAAVPRGGKGIMTVTLSVSAKYHVNAHTPNDPAYIPTVFTPRPVPGIQFGPVHYPAPKMMKLSYSPKPLLVYTGQVKVSVPFTVTQAAKSGLVPLSGTVDFQGCDAQSCFPPASAPVKAVVLVK